MSEDLVIKHCAPTLAGLKTGNLFNASYDSRQELDRDVAQLNMILERRGLRVIVLKTKAGRALIYIYRPRLLHNDLNRREAREILSRFGYKPADPDSCISLLADRISLDGEYPHEIGLFLGYPPEDVKGFISFRGKGCKACGYWKVYGDIQSAEKRFAQYRKCTGVYLRCLKCGASLEKLAVKKKI